MYQATATALVLGAPATFAQTAFPGPSPTGFPSSGRDATYSLDLRQGDRVALDCTMPKDDACVYLVSDCVDVSRNCLAWSDSGISGDKEAIDWVVPASGRYFLIVDSYGKNAGGPFTLNLSFACVTPNGACCSGGLACRILTEDDCVSLHSFYLGDDATCGPGSCEPLPVLMTSWGALKHEYR